MLAGLSNVFISKDSEGADSSPDSCTAVTLIVYVVEKERFSNSKLFEEGELINISSE